MRSRRKAASGWKTRAATMNSTHDDATEAVAAPQCSDGRISVRKYLVAALRHCRRAAELNLRDGPTADVGESVRHARDALDGVAFVCEYAAAEGEP